MEYSIDVSEDKNYIVLKVTGEFTAESFMQCIIESHELGRQEKVNCYLVDVRNARNVDSAYGSRKFAYHDMKTTDGVDPLARVAGLVSPGDNSHDFVAMASTNAGMFLKLFTDIEEAKNYLMKK